MYPTPNPMTTGTERHPSKPYTPPGGVPYKVTSRDDWGSVARDKRVDVRALIYHNFKTNDPGVVNYLLRTVTGCNVPTRDGYNWKFSDSAKPGIIFIPTTTVTFDGETTTAAPQGQNDLANYLDGLEDFDPSTRVRIEHYLSLVEIAHIAIGVGLAEALFSAAVAAGIDLAATLIGAPAALVGGILAISNAYDEGIAYIKKDKFLMGFSYGVVLGANGASNRYIQANFVPGLDEFKNPQFPEETNNFWAAYLQGLARGATYGRQLNNAEIVKLFAYLTAQAGRWSDDELAKWQNWSNQAKIDYYEYLGGIFRRDFLPRP